MTQPGQVVFSKMEEVVYGKPAAETVAAPRPPPRRRARVPDGERHAQPRRPTRSRSCAARSATTASAPSTGCRRTRRARAVIAAAEQAREAQADLIVTLGGGSITDGAKAVQLCLANDIRTPEAMDALRRSARRRRKPPTVPQISVPTTLRPASSPPSPASPTSAPR